MNNVSEEELKTGYYVFGYCWDIREGGFLSITYLENGKYIEKENCENYTDYIYGEKFYGSFDTYEDALNFKRELSDKSEFYW